MSKAPAAESLDFSLPELVDLALCSPEIGAVNFNILRILLHNIIDKLGIVGQKATVNDLQSHQINNFKKYIQGAGTASPMPGVLRYAPGIQPLDPSKTPRTPRQEQQQAYQAQPQQQQQQLQQFPMANANNVQQPPALASSGAQSEPAGPSYAQSIGAVYTRHTTVAPNQNQAGGAPVAAGSPTSSPPENLEKKVARLERHLEALYALPTNSRILGTGNEDGQKKENMSVNDMWQIIQLNNRVAAVEAGIQKMASLIEELASQIKSLKNSGKSTSSMKKEFDKVAKTSSNLAMQMEPCMEKCEQTAASLGRLKGDLEKIKKHLIGEIQKLSAAAGVSTTKTPSFMGPRVSITDTLQGQGQGQGQKSTRSGQTPGQGKSGMDKASSSSQQASQSTGVQVVTNVTSSTMTSSKQQKSTAGTVTSTKQQRQADGSLASGQERGSDGSSLAGQQHRSDGSPFDGEYRGSDSDGSPIIDGQEIGPDGLPVPVDGQQRRSDGSPTGGQKSGSDGQEITDEHGAPGEQSGFREAASGQQRGSDGGQQLRSDGGQEQQRRSDGGQGQQRKSDGGQEQQRRSDGGQGQQRRSDGGQEQQRRSDGGQGQQRRSDGGQGQQRRSDGGTIEGAGGEFEGSPHLSPPNSGDDNFLENYDGSRTSGEQRKLSSPYDGDDGGSDEKYGYDENRRESRDSATDAEEAGTGREPSGDGGHGKRTSRASQSDIPEDAHGRHSGRGTLSESHPEQRHQGISHVPVDVSGVPLDQGYDEFDPFKDFTYPTILDDGTVVPGEMDARFQEECKGQADLVQKELQEQYAKLVEMQRQMADEIQDKMELVYQKLLREISAQNATTSPYMAVGLNAEKCLGPGVCSGFGLPAGTAVCQFPQKPEKVDICSKDGKVCPGKDVCPGKEVCPTCKNDILHHLRSPGDKPRAAGLDYGKSGLSSSQENLLRQLTSMTLLPRDLEELRESLKERGIMPEVFDEADVLEKLQTLWEAVNVLKNNEENMAVRLIQQDAVLKRIPEDAMQKLEHLGTGPVENLDEARFSKGIKGMKDLGGEDLQLIFNNLSSLVLENGAMKEKLQKINDMLFEFEQNVVTKPMLMNALGDKADKGQMNTKVSYDEFGTGMDELQSRLGNLLQEVYRKNELWKDITDQMREDLSEKLDKVEIGPLRAYFKNHLVKLEEKVNHLTRIMEEPDPAGTRKKLLRDYNCLSCDRHTNISGVTNAPLLPVLGPILAGHTTASKRAFELYRMRPKTAAYDADGRNFCQMERQGRGEGNNPMESSMPLNDSDMLHLVNRYVGGSHTAISTQDRIAALHKRVSLNANAAVKPNVLAEVSRPRTSAGSATYYYDE